MPVPLMVAALATTAGIGVAVVCTTANAENADSGNNQQQDKKKRVEKSRRK